MNRETIYGALFAKLQTASGFTTINRHLKHLSDVDAAQLPALFQIQKRENVIQTKGLPSIWRLEVDLYIYVQTTAADTSGAIALNPLLDAVEAVLTDSVTNTQTLGGTVSHCWITGGIDIYEGVQDVMTVAIIPLEILTNH